MDECYDDQIWAAETPTEYNSVKTVKLCDLMFINEPTFKRMFLKNIREEAEMAASGGKIFSKASFKYNQILELENQF